MGEDACEEGREERDPEVPTGDVSDDCGSYDGQEDIYDCDVE